MLIVSKIQRALEFLKERRFQELGLRILSLVPWLFRYDHFYFVECPPSSLKASKRSNGPVVTINAYSPELLAKIEADLPGLNTEVIKFQIAGRNPEEVKVLSCMDEAKRHIAVSFAARVSELRSPSGARIHFSSEKSVLWVFGTFVAKAHRYQGHFVELMHAAASVCTQNGCKILMGELHGPNINAIRTHSRIGFKVFQHLHYIQFFHWKHFWKGENEFSCKL